MATYNNYNNNNKDKKKDTNTRGIQLYSLKGFDPSTMALGFWNDYCSVKIHPALPEAKRTEKGMYDYDTSIGIVFTADRCAALADVLEKHIIPAVENEVTEDVSYAIPIKNGEHIIEVGNGIKINDRITPYVAIYKNITAQGTPEQEIGFEFLSEDVFKGYDTQTGEKEVIQRFDGMYVFLEYLKSSTGALTKAHAHTSRDLEKYIISKVLENQDKIMDNLGIARETYSNQNNSSPRKMGGGNNSDSTGVRNNIEESDIDQLEKELGV